jgi:tetratricopeptide (TPR) repeat protein
LDGLSTKDREVLHTLVGFRMPASYFTLEALLIGPNKVCDSTQELDRVLTELEDRGLIGWDRGANRYDAHPIVRGVVWQLTTTEDQGAVYTAIESHFQPMVIPEWERVETLADLSPAIERYHTLVGLGRYDDAFVLFRDRLESATLYRLAAHRERITWLKQLFPDGVVGLPALTEDRDRSRALNALALSYLFSGQAARSVPLFREACHLYQRTGLARDHRMGLSTLGATLGDTGALREAVNALRQVLILGRGSNDEFAEAVSLQFLGHALDSTSAHALGQVALRRSRRISMERGYSHLGGTVNAYLAEHALWAGDPVKAGVWAERFWELAAGLRVEQDVIYAALLQGRVSLGQGDFARADEHLHNALTRACAVNVVELELPALIAIAQLELKRDDLARAKARLEDVWEAAEHGPYPLRQADAFNVLTAVELVEGNKSAAIDAATRAFEVAWCDGPPFAYHWGLEKAKAHLAALGAPEPDLPPFDESKFEPMPRVEINPRNKYWVNPDKLD